MESNKQKTGRTKVKFVVDVEKATTASAVANFFVGRKENPRKGEACGGRQDKKKTSVRPVGGRPRAHSWV